MSIYITAEGENGFYRYVNSGGRMVESPVKLTGLDSQLKMHFVGIQEIVLIKVCFSLIVVKEAFNV